MLRVKQFSGKFGITLQGVFIRSSLQVIWKKRVCSVPAYSAFQVTTTCMIQRSSSSR